MKRFVMTIAVAALVAAAPPEKAAPASPKITADEKAMLIGYQERARAIRLQAELDLRAVAAERDEYLSRIARRLGLPSLDPYEIDPATLEVRLKAQAKVQPKETR